MSDNPWKAMGLVGAVGADLAICMWAGYFAGSVVDKKLGTDLVWSILGLGVGLVVGISTVILLIKRTTGDERNQ